MFIINQEIIVLENKDLTLEGEMKLKEMVENTKMLTIEKEFSLSDFNLANIREKVLACNLVGYSLIYNKEARKGFIRNFVLDKSVKDFKSFAKTNCAICQDVKDIFVYDEVKKDFIKDDTGRRLGFVNEAEVDEYFQIFNLKKKNYTILKKKNNKEYHTKLASY